MVSCQERVWSLNKLFIKKDLLLKERKDFKLQPKQRKLLSTVILCSEARWPGNAGPPGGWAWSPVSSIQGGRLLFK